MLGHAKSNVRNELGAMVIWGMMVVALSAFLTTAVVQMSNQSQKVSFNPRLTSEISDVEAAILARAEMTSSYETDGITLNTNAQTIINKIAAHSDLDLLTDSSNATSPNIHVSTPTLTDIENGVTIDDSALCGLNPTPGNPHPCRQCNYVSPYICQDVTPGNPTGQYYFQAVVNYDNLRNIASISKRRLIEVHIPTAQASGSCPLIPGSPAIFFEGFDSGGNVQCRAINNSCQPGSYLTGVDPVTYGPNCTSLGTGMIIPAGGSPSSPFSYYMKSLQWGGGSAFTASSMVQPDPKTYYQFKLNNALYPPGPPSGTALTLPTQQSTNLWYAPAAQNLVQYQVLVAYDSSCTGSNPSTPGFTNPSYYNQGDAISGSVQESLFTIGTVKVTQGNGSVLKTQTLPANTKMFSLADIVPTMGTEALTFTLSCSAPTMQLLVQAADLIVNVLTSPVSEVSNITMNESSHSTSPVSFGSSVLTNGFFVQSANVTLSMKNDGSGAYETRRFNFQYGDLSLSDFVKFSNWTDAYGSTPISSVSSGVLTVSADSNQRVTATFTPTGSTAVNLAIAGSAGANNLAVGVSSFGKMRTRFYTSQSCTKLNKTYSAKPFSAKLLNLDGKTLSTANPVADYELAQLTGSSSKTLPIAIPYPAGDTVDTAATYTYYDAWVRNDQSVYYEALLDSTVATGYHIAVTQYPWYPSAIEPQPASGNWATPASWPPPAPSANGSYDVFQNIGSLQYSRISGSLTGYSTDLSRVTPTGCGNCWPLLPAAIPWDIRVDCVPPTPPPKPKGVCDVDPGNIGSLCGEPVFEYCPFDGGNATPGDQKGPHYYRNFLINTSDPSNPKIFFVDAANITGDSHNAFAEFNLATNFFVTQSTGKYNIGSLEVNYPFNYYGQLGDNCHHYRGLNNLRAAAVSDGNVTGMWLSFSPLDLTKVGSYPLNTNPGLNPLGGENPGHFSQTVQTNPPYSGLYTLAADTYTNPEDARKEIQTLLATPAFGIKWEYGEKIAPPPDPSPGTDAGTDDDNRADGTYSPHCQVACEQP